MASKLRSENAKEWRERVARAEGESGSLRSYCRAEGVSLSSLKYWRRKFGVAEPPAMSAPRPSRFIPVELVSSAVEPEREERLLPDPKWVAEIILHLSGSSR